MFGAGEPIFRLFVGEQLCLNGQCTSKADFVAEYISDAFPSNCFDQILEGKPIALQDSNIVKTHDGFEQSSQSEHYEILYKVDKSGIVFIEKHKNIIIKIKEIEE